MKKITLGISAIVLAASGAAFAATHGPPPNPDANGDGIITRAEAQNHAAKMFAMLDVNGDGKLDATDRAARMQQRRAEMFTALDTNGDGQISRDEFMLHEHKGPHGMWGDGDRPHRMGRRGSMRMMERLDTNHDGAVSQAEFTAGAMAMFDRADTNHDGKVTQAERDAAHKAMRDKWRERMHDQPDS